LGEFERRILDALHVVLVVLLRQLGQVDAVAVFDRVLLTELPSSTGKKLPRYPTVPMVRMGRLAVDQAFRGQGLGSALLADALGRAARSEMAAHALMVDAKDAAAANFYQHHGFIALPDSPRTLFLPLASVRAV